MADEEQKQNEGEENTDTAPEVNAGDAKTFTQDEVNEIVGQRAKRAEEKARKELAEKLGFKSIKDMEATVSAARQAQEQELSELERTKKRAEELEAANKELEANSKARIVRTEVRAQAALLGFKDLDDAYALADLSEVEMTEDGAVTGIGEALKALAKAKPYLVGDEPSRPAAPKTDAGIGNPPKVGGEALSSGERFLVTRAKELGLNVDPDKVVERKGFLKSLRRQSRETGD